MDLHKDAKGVASPSGEASAWDVLSLLAARFRASSPSFMASVEEVSVRLQKDTQKSRETTRCGDSESSCGSVCGHFSFSHILILH